MSSYKLFLPRRACCCCDLSTCGMLVGWLGGITYFSNMVMGIESLSKNTVMELPDNTPNPEFIELVARVILVLDIIVSIVNLIGCVCLIVGIMKRVKSFIQPWLYGQILLIITWIFVDLVLVTLVVGKYSIVYVAGLIVVTSGIAIVMYLWICMYALYKELHRADMLLQLDTYPETFKSNPTF